MADTNAEQPGGRTPVDALGGVLGLLVFLAGVAMIALVFSWTYRLFDSMDEELTGGIVVASGSGVPSGGHATSTGSGSEPVNARPRGPSLGQNAIKLALKLLCLLILALCGSLLAAKGAQLAGAYRGKRT